MSKWPLYAVLLAGLFLLGILVYSVNFAHNQEEEQGGTPKMDIKEEEKPLLMGEGRGLAPQLGQATLQLLQKNLNIRPTLEIRPGYQFNVIVTKDLVFERPYRAQR